MSRISIFALFVTIFFIGGLAEISAQNAKVLAEAQRLTGDRFTVTGRTPLGANVYGVKRASREMMAAIDRGLTDLFAIARRNGYRAKLNYFDYSIYIGNADRQRNAAGEYSPDIAVGTAQYAGTVYDHGGYMYVAGMIVANNPCSFMIGEHTRDYKRVSDVVRFEGEHLILYHNDRRRYMSTRDHSQGGGHPILQ